VKRHRFDPVSFIWGAFFVGFGLAFLTDAVEPSVMGLRAFWPLAVVAFGLAILSSVRRNPVTEDERPSSEPASEPS
jgi:hypothetical protein